MKDIDIEKIGKKMPYKAPSQDFFDNFANEVLNTVAERKRKKIFMRRAMIAVAAVFMGAAAIFNFYYETEDSYAPMDNFILSMSDEDLSNLIFESQLEEEFYSNL